MKLPFVARSAFEQVCAERDRLVAQLIALQTRSDSTLREALDVMRESRKAPEYPAPPVSPLAALGPRTTAALTEMGNGLPPANRRAMEAKALALWAETKGDDRDAVVAERVRKGEPVGR